MPATARLRGTARRVMSLFGDRALILLYHRVSDGQPDPWSMNVSPEHFAEHLDLVRRFGYPLSLQELAGAVARGAVPRGAVAVTFDDGYADNLHAARPLLERHGVPATVFVSSGAVENPREFWWDELERIFLHPGTLPPALELEIDGRRRSWQLGAAAYYDATAAERHRSWNAQDSPPSPRHRLFLEIWRTLLPLPLTEQHAALDRLARWAGSDPNDTSGYRTLTEAELVALARGGLLEIGAHTVTHPILSGLPAAAQRMEIRQSKARLEEILQRPVTSFAYPFGAYPHYTRQSVRLVREAGFACACSAIRGVVTRYADRYQLPRLYMSDWNGDRFAAILSRCLRARAA